MDLFQANERDKASKARLVLEIDMFQQGLSREIVLLEADSEEALRKTHNRYFRGVSDLAKSIKPSVKFNDLPPD